MCVSGVTVKPIHQKSELPNCHAFPLCAWILRYSLHNNSMSGLFQLSPHVTYVCHARICLAYVYVCFKVCVCVCVCVCSVHMYVFVCLWLDIFYSSALIDKPDVDVCVCVCVWVCVCVLIETKNGIIHNVGPTFETTEMTIQCTLETIQLTLWRIKCFFKKAKKFNFVAQDFLQFLKPNISNLVKF